MEGLECVFEGGRNAFWENLGLFFFLYRVVGEGVERENLGKSFLFGDNRVL